MALPNWLEQRKKERNKQEGRLGGGGKNEDKNYSGKVG